MALRNVVPVWMIIAGALALIGCGPGHTASSDAGGRGAEQSPIAGSLATGPLPDSAFKASISVSSPPTKLRPGQKELLEVTVKNIGNATWPAHGRSGDGYFQVNLGNVWFAGDARITDNPYLRSGLPNDVPPGATVTLPLEITAPGKPGEYLLQIDLVQEMVSWFSEKGNNSPKVKVKVGD